MSPPDPTQSTGSRAGPSPEWRTMFEVWRDRSFDLAVPLERLSPDSRRLISGAGALCHAIVTGEIRSDIAPESASLFEVARGLAAPATSLQRAWVEYQNLCLSCAQDDHTEAVQQLQTAELAMLSVTGPTGHNRPIGLTQHELLRRGDAAGALDATRLYLEHKRTVDSAAAELERAQGRVAELAGRLAILNNKLCENSHILPSFVYYRLCSTTPFRAHQSSFPSFLDGFESRGAGLWILRGQPCHKDALQLAFPQAVQGQTELTEKPYVNRWALDAGRVHARDRERIEPLLTAMQSALCCSTSLDAYFALDWYKAHDEATAQWHNSELGEMVYQAKYHGRRDLVATLAARLAELIRVHPLYSSARLLAAVPCLPSKQYDLPRHLCATLTPLIRKVDATGSLRKVRETKPMKDIDDHAEKLSNVSGAFRADALSIAGDDVILVDDTYGSGVTLWEVARTLRDSGARRVLGISCVKNRGFR